jgi:hypothetical protein
VAEILQGLFEDVKKSSKDASVNEFKVLLSIRTIATMEFGQSQCEDLNPLDLVTNRSEVLKYRPEHFKCIQEVSALVLQHLRRLPSFADWKKPPSQTDVEDVFMILDSNTFGCGDHGCGLFLSSSMFNHRLSVFATPEN